MCRGLLKDTGAEIKIPGLLVIDTPGHSAFVNLRKRGGSIADIAILVVDVNRGFELQTHECVGILKTFKTPFVVAANKIDLIPGWRPDRDDRLSITLAKQETSVRRELDNRLFNLMGTLSRLGFRSDMYEKISDFRKSVAIIPVSAKNGTGIPELLAVLVGLTQQFMRQRLSVSRGLARGNVLEVKEEPGLGVTINAIVYDGILHRGDIIVLAGKDRPISSRIRALLLPKPLDEIRDPRDKFQPVDEVQAAAGVKVAAPDLSDALAGSPLYATDDERAVASIMASVAEEVGRLRISTDTIGVVLKADTLGSLEAITTELQNHNIPIRIADIGDVSRRDVVEAALVKRSAPLLGVVLAFNVKVLPDAEEEIRAQRLNIFRGEIIYHVIDEYLQWQEAERLSRISEELGRLTRPGRLMILPGCIFRRSNPAIVGVEILEGVVKPHTRLIRDDGRIVGEIMQIQDKGVSLDVAEKGRQVAISIKEAVVGRHISERDELMIDLPEGDYKAIQTRFAGQLPSEELELLKKLAEVKRKANPAWGL
jgi:translation initiation factor 5B